MNGSNRDLIPRTSAPQARGSNCDGFLPEAGAGRPYGKGFQIEREELNHYVRLYADNPIFSDTHTLIIDDNPFRRPIDPDLVSRLDFSEVLTGDRSLGVSALAAHRMLLNIYEADLIFLPEANSPSKQEDFALFYSNRNKILGEIIRPALEQHVFGFLEREIEVTGGWTLEALRAYMDSVVRAHEQSRLAIVTAVLSARNPERAAASLMIQVAGDFLSEASASARNVLGKYGRIQSELFKIVIDDYGYGVHETKHSTLFENTMKSCGLVPQVHAYWHFYLTSSLALSNYYHFLCRDHSKIFRALGAIAMAEAMFSHTCKQIAEMLRAVFGPRVDAYYFDEHVGIDSHHGRMASEYVLAPAVVKYGEGIITDIVLGLEGIRLVTGISDRDFIAQLSWSERAESYRRPAQIIHRRIISGEVDCPGVSRTLRRDRPSASHVYDEDSLYVVESGAMELIAGYDAIVRLDAGESIVVPRPRLHSTRAVSDECAYRVYALGDHESCLL
jgi:mannose-6-phosphate isomerase-like protein (cupin superfamily)